MRLINKEFLAVVTPLVKHSKIPFHVLCSSQGTMFLSKMPNLNIMEVYGLSSSSSAAELWEGVRRTGITNPNINYVKVRFDLNGGSVDVADMTQIATAWASGPARESVIFELHRCNVTKTHGPVRTRSGGVKTPVWSMLPEDPTTFVAVCVSIVITSTPTTETTTTTTFLRSCTPV